ncbi:MAG: tetratricopeptide repeat protein [Alphaproteobacteria bacterium]|nr:tetratricopeptide repeat protein [Alphaproteobacteria bacterium]
MDNEQLAARLREAVAQHRQGDLAQALAGYDSILATAPDYFDALHLKGVIAAQQKRHDEAVALMRRALSIKPDHAGAHGNLGGLLLRLGRAEEALACFDALIALQPELAAAQGARANTLHMLGRLDQAVSAYDRALALNADDTEGWYNRGNALQALGHAREALASHDRAVALRPDHVNAIYGQGNALQMLGRHEEALARYDQAIALRSDHAEAWSSRGNALRRLGRLEDALASHDRSLALKPDNADAQYNRGTVLRALGRPDEALASHDRALALKPDHPRAHGSRANALRDLGRFEEALASYQSALALMPDHADTWSDRGTALQGLLRLDEALASYERAIALDARHVDAHWNRATALLLSGDLARGWREFEWRWRTMTKGRPGSWLGEAKLRGRSIVLRSEQGLGDTVQFARYAPLVMAEGARVILSVQAPLRRLMASLDPEIEVVAAGEAVAELDCPLMSLPLALGTTLDSIPAPPRYLAAEPDLVEAWRARLPTGKRRIGLVWSGNPNHRNDRNRSLSLATLAPLFEIDAHWIALQKDVPARDVATLDRLSLIRVADQLGDFADTAALIEALDLVIAVDTSVAHLAGALGKAVWILLPFSPDWRWLTAREDSPWYPSARLLRQTTPGDWAGVVDRVVEALG